MAANLAKLHEAADKALEKEARDLLTEKLHAGESIARLDLRDLIDSDLNGPRAGFAAIEITNLLLADSGERNALADTYVTGVIDRFLNSGLGEDAIQEKVAELAVSE